MTALGPLEGAVMEILWARAESMTVRQVMDELNRHRRSQLAYTTVMTTLARLADKDAVTRHPHGRGYVYQPAGRDPAALAVRSVLGDYGDAAIARFVEQVEADPERSRRLRRLLEDEPP